jgi:antitoxin component YwqK of YwqJK toxin-antitoxin module
MLLPVGAAGAWSQPAHRQINTEAVDLFMRRYGASEMSKYQLGPIDQAAYGMPLRGIAVTSRSLLIEPWSPAGWMGFGGYELADAQLTPAEWVVAGGDWADEPHLYASVRHFFDPLALWGQRYLTDQYEYHGWYDAPGIDARTWALDHPDNPYSFRDALLQYRAALQVKEQNWAPGTTIGGTHFKTNIDMTPASAEEERQLHLARAYRALGETMHLLADMTQPAHVRNDSHPYDEPIEDNTFSTTVSAVAGSPVDAHVAPYLLSAGGALQAPAELFQQVALFTNQQFYSSDTIYDAAAGVIPANIALEDYMSGRKAAYASPQFSDLLVQEDVVTTWRGERTVRQLNAPLVNDEIPLAKERLSTVWFGPLDAVNAAIHAVRPYQVPPSFAYNQARVLIPVATHACADLMHLFYPTLELVVTYQAESVGAADAGRQVIVITPEMVHHVGDDPAWAAYDLQIAYSGPGRLVITPAEGQPVTRQLEFVGGKLSRLEAPGGEMVEAPLKINVAAPAAELTALEAHYAADPGTQLHIEIAAGSRKFTSAAYLIKAQEITVTIAPPRLLLLELQQGATWTEVTFEALATPAGRHQYVWDFDDGGKIKDRPDGGAPSMVSHNYTYLKDGDVFHPKVSIFDANDKLLAEDTITIEVTEIKEVHTSDYDCGWEVDYSELTMVEGDTWQRWTDADRKLHGPRFSWFDATKSQLFMADCWDHGQVTGKITVWQEDGAKVSETYQVNGVPEGPATYWWPNGNLKTQNTMRAGKAQGLSTGWYENGQMHAQGLKENAVATGIWQYWDEDGSCSTLWDQDANKALPCP